MMIFTILMQQHVAYNAYLAAPVATQCEYVWQNKFHNYWTNHECDWSLDVYDNKYKYDWPFALEPCGNDTESGPKRFIRHCSKPDPYRCLVIDVNSKGQNPFLNVTWYTTNRGKDLKSPRLYSVPFWSNEHKLEPTQYCCPNRRITPANITFTEYESTNDKPLTGASDSVLLKCIFRAKYIDTLQQLSQIYSYLHNRDIYKIILTYVCNRTPFCIPERDLDDLDRIVSIYPSTDYSKLNLKPFHKRYLLYLPPKSAE